MQEITQHNKEISNKIESFNILKGNDREKQQIMEQGIAIGEKLSWSQIDYLGLDFEKRKKLPSFEQNFSTEWKVFYLEVTLKRASVEFELNNGTNLESKASQALEENKQAYSQALQEKGMHQDEAKQKTTDITGEYIDNFDISSHGTHDKESPEKPEKQLEEMLLSLMFPQKDAADS